MIYALFYRHTERAVFHNLSHTAYITAWFYLEEDELNKEEFAVIMKQFREEVLNPFYQIYDIENKVNYGAKDPVVSDTILSEIRKKGEYAFTQDNFLCYGIYYEDNQGDFVIITKERRAVLTDQMLLLFWILSGAFLFGIIAIVGLSRWIAVIAYKPFTRVINQVNNISTNNLDVKIQSSGTQDELQKLIDTFNDLLQRISETFIIQRNFVSYISHEFKTPLASMLGNLEVFSLKDRSPQEYSELSLKLIQQIYQLEEILNTLMVVSDLVKSSEVNAQSRIDELIWEIINKISINYPKAKICVKMDISPEDESLLSIQNDRTQLLMALYNLIENAVKYSQGEKVDIHIFRTGYKMALSISDKGIGIPKEQLENISKPFYRADNTNKIQGSGIGLSIALRILEKNNIEYKIESGIGEGTEVTLLFPELTLK